MTKNQIRKRAAYFLRTLFFLLLLNITLPVLSPAQFYNGSQLNFGKKRVQYDNFQWTYYRYERFDTYFYLNGKELAIFAAEYADKHMKEIEQELQSDLEEKVQFIIFNNLSDLKQSNIGLTGDWDTYNTGGVTRIMGGKVLVYFDGDYIHFEQQIRAGIVTVLLNEMIYGSGIGSQIKNSTLFTMPEWYMNGLIAYVSKKWDTETDNIVRDAFQSGKYTKFNRLTGLEASYAGHSLWNYIALQYGESTIPNIVNMARLNRNVERGFTDVLGLSFKEIMAEWLKYYQTMYAAEDSLKAKPSGSSVIRKIKKDRVYRQFKIAPGSEHAAYVTHELGVHKIFLVDMKKNSKKRIYRGGYRLEEKEDYTFPLLAWHPTGEVLAILTEKKGHDVLYMYSLKDKRVEKQDLFDFDKILDLSYSDDGTLLVFSAVRQGQSDIFVYNIASGSWEQITKDIFNDMNPRFINQSKEIIFSSNRNNDTIRWDKKINQSELSSSNDIFIYDYAGKKKILRRITRSPMANEIMPMPYSGKYFTYLSDDNGIYNRYVARFDSTISFIDTTTHYRYYTISVPVTNYSRNILEQNIAPGSDLISEVIFRNNKDEFYYRQIEPPTGKDGSELINSNYRDIIQKENENVKEDDKEKEKKGEKQNGSKKHKRFHTVMESELQQKVQDTTRQNAQQTVWTKLPDDVMLRDSILTMMNTSARTVKPAETDTGDKYRDARFLNYNVEYSIDQTVAQIDFNYLNSAYQPFTGAKSPIFINPGLNALFMVGITDLMEDYRLTGGIRLNFDLINNEYLFRYANMKRRIDHQIIFHRQSLDETGYYSLIRHHVHELYYIITYPFSPVLYLDGTATIRYDRSVFLSTDQLNLAMPDVNMVWGSLKGELTYDNTRKTGMNLYNGTRYKIFGEYYNELSNAKQNMVVVGADFRHYRKIHRSMILALRFAASTSLGNNKLIYYMGGVDNWFVPTFNPTTPVAYDQNYAFQTLATNMRGFSQNIRNGNSFAVFNSEIRVPVFRYFLNRPIRSDFINNFQVVAFGDAGTAWTSLSPYSSENRLFINYIRKPPLFIKVEMMKDPIVEGFGFGLRAHLFGYFLRGDLAWGVEDGRVQKPIFYFSLSLDF